MCGILGFYNLQELGGGGSFEGAFAKLAHRGPDSSGTYQYENLLLAHHRLSILDLSPRGHQPMVSDCGQYVIVFNGEIYNHLELRKDLTEVHFQSHTDTETILYGFRKFGRTFFERLNGIFALAILDLQKKELTVVRDHLGIKPLYLYQKGDAFAFASELKSFLAIEGFDKSLNYSSLQNYLTLLWSPGADCPFAYVKKLLPGHLITINLRGRNDFQSYRFYDIPFTNSRSAKTEVDLLDEFEFLFSNAVSRQMLSDVPVGFFVSGGLDSSAVLAMAQKAQPEVKFQGFTIKTGDGDDFDGFSNDLKYARLLGQKFNLELHEISGEVDILRNFDQMVYHLDEPQADLAPLHVYNICLEARRLGYKVLLGGTAGDDLLSGYRRHSVLSLDPLIDCIPKILRKVIAKAAETINTSHPSLRRIKKLLLDFGLDFNQRHINSFNWYSPRRARALFSTDLRNRIDPYSTSDFFHKILQEIPFEHDPLNQLLFLEMRSFLVDHNLNYTDKMSMACGVEVRVPFLDLDLVNFCCTLPTHLKLKGMKTKFILRESMKKYLPPKISSRPKAGFGAPVRKWIKKDLKPMIEEYLAPHAVRERGIFDATQVANLILDNEKGYVDGSYTILSLLAIESWMRSFVDGKSPPPLKPT